MDKQKRETRQLSSLTIVILWAIIQGFGWAILYLLATSIPYRDLNLLTYGFIGIFSGGVVGALQHTLIDRGAGITLHRWLMLTAVGMAGGLIVMDLMWSSRTPLFWGILPIFIIPALLQWFSVRQHTRTGILWIGAHLVTTLVFVMFYEMISAQQSVEMLTLVIPAALQGVASGFVMVWLLRRLPNQELTHEKPKMRYDDTVKVS